MPPDSTLIAIYEFVDTFITIPVIIIAAVGGTALIVWSNLKAREKK